MGPGPVQTQNASYLLVFLVIVGTGWSATATTTRGGVGNGRPLVFAAKAVPKETIKGCCKSPFGKPDPASDHSRRILALSTHLASSGERVQISFLFDGCGQSALPRGSRATVSVESYWHL